MDELTSKIFRSHHRENKRDSYRGKAEDLIARDDDEQNDVYGQRVRDTFPLADVVINAETEGQIRNTLSRFVRAFYRDNFITPSIDEYGSFLAKTAALRSADLSRQVGAAILMDRGEVLTAGCNDVPKAGGGQYWEGDSEDSRDFQIGYDSSSRIKKEILEDLFRRIKPILDPKYAGKDVEDLAETTIFSKDNAILKDSMVMDILEFGRIVHAEMSALSEAAKRGVSVKGATLYCTTFPCHICARHIIASGIKRVVYIEPYSKSLATELYPEAIWVEGSGAKTSDKVAFDQFVGIAPLRYAEVFEKNKRKDKKGMAEKWDPQKASPIVEILVPAYMNVEAAVTTAFLERLSTVQKSPTLPGI